MMESKAEDRPLTPDPVLSDEVVLGLVRRHVPDAAEVKHVDETGNRARAYWIDEELVLKTQRPSKIRPQTSLEKEVFFLNQIRADERIRVPRVLGYGTEGGVQYTLMTRMPGTAFRWINPEGEERRRVLHELGRTLRLIHGLDSEPFKESPYFQGNIHVIDVKESFQQSFNAVVESLGSRPAGWTLAITTEQAAQKVMDSFPPDVETVAIHANPGPPHAFVHTESKQFSGLIDFGDACINHPAMDFAAWGSPTDQKMVLEGYTADAAVSREFIAVWHSVVILQLLRRSLHHGLDTLNEDLTHWLSRM